MARIRKIERLSKSEHESLLFDLVYALVQTKNTNEAILFLQDLLTKSEITILAKRLRIAKLLLSGLSYEDIVTRVKVSHGTIAKIAAWLTDKGEGFRNILNKLPKEQKLKSFEDITEWDTMKRKYSIYFWPELLLEEIIKNANKKQKDRISGIMQRLDEKSKLHKRIEKLLEYSTT